MTRPPVDADVIVVGAGPAGSATALLLARRGHRVVLVDRARFPRPKPCGEYLNPGAVEALRRLDLLEAVRPAGVTISGLHLAALDGTSIWAPFPAGGGLLIARDRLDHLLLRAAERAGAQVMEECRVDAVAPGRVPEIVVRHRERPARLRARLIVGADGMRSVVARAHGPLEPAVNGHYTVGAHFEGLRVDGPRGDLHLGQGWYAGAAVLGCGRANVVAALPRVMLREARGDAGAAFAAACVTLPTLRRMMDGARRIGEFVSAGPLGYTRRRVIGDGVLLVGDAAGTINPMTGEGIALALRGAELAADASDRALRVGETSHRALRGYARARAAAFRDIWRASRLLQWITRRPHLAAFLFRGLAADPLLASRLLGVVGDVRAPREALTPGFILRVITRARAARPDAA